MLAENLSALAQHPSPSRLDVLRKKLLHVHLADKAESLTVFFLRRRESELFCEPPHIALLHAADRKQDMPELFLADLPQEITLVLPRVRTREQTETFDF